jgi:hypothetical protein
MKKLTQLIKESLVNFDFIEDCMLHFEDMGFTIENLNSLNSKKRHYLFTQEDKTGFNLYTHSPMEGLVNYPCYIVTLTKPFKPFEDQGTYLSVAQNVESLKKRLKDCYVSYSINTEIENGDYTNGNGILTIVFYIVDKSSKISEEMTTSLRGLESFVRQLMNGEFKKLSSFFGILFENNQIVLRINYPMNPTINMDIIKEIKEAIEEIEIRCNSDFNVKTKTYFDEKYGYLEIKPKL